METEGTAKASKDYVIQKAKRGTSALFAKPPDTSSSTVEGVSGVNTVEWWLPPSDGCSQLKSEVKPIGVEPKTPTRVCSRIERII